MEYSKRKKITMRDYVVDGGDGAEMLYSTKRGAIKAAQELADKSGEPISIWSWYRPDRDDDLVFDEGFELVISPKEKK